MAKINGIIVNGRVYEINDNVPCLLSQETISFRYSQELTDKLKEK